MSVQKREHFRISYPVAECAKMATKGGKFSILDISQSGIKFSLNSPSDAAQYQVNQEFNGIVYFLSGSQHPVFGRVLRIGPTYIVLILEEAIPLKNMYDEHRYIIQKFDR